MCIDKLEIDFDIAKESCRANGRYTYYASSHRHLTQVVSVPYKASSNFFSPFKDEYCKLLQLQSPVKPDLLVLSLSPNNNCNTYLNAYLVLKILMDTS